MSKTDAGLVAALGEAVHERNGPSEQQRHDFRLTTPMDSASPVVLNDLAQVTAEHKDVVSKEEVHEASSDLSSSFSSDSSTDDDDDDEDEDDNSSKQKRLLNQLPSKDELTRSLETLGTTAFLREYLHSRRYATLEILLALELPIPDAEFTRGDLTTYLRRHLTGTTEQVSHADSLEQAVRLISSARNIMVITGAGISTSLGIPDFRSEHGIYSQLEKYNLFDPQEMFDIDLFHQDPSIFYDFCKELIPDGKKRYSPTHAFIRLLQNQGRLLRLYTQNIDNIESHAGIQEAHLVQCHGSFRTFSCVTCGASVPGEYMFGIIKAGQIPTCKLCLPPTSSDLQSTGSSKTKQHKSGKKRKRASWQDDDESFNDDDDQEAAGLVDGGPSTRGASFGVMKPDMTFFGEQLPTRFKTLMSDDRKDADLLICIGTSLKVAPVAAIPRVLESSVPQIFISREPATRDYIFDLELLGACDDIVSQMAHEAGWSNDLEILIEQGKH